MTAAVRKTWPAARTGKEAEPAEQPASSERSRPVTHAATRVGRVSDQSLIRLSQIGEACRDTAFSATGPERVPG